MKYTISYGCGVAVLYTPHDAKERFNTLANTCFGIRKSIMDFRIINAEDVPCPSPYYERLEFSGDVYVWRKDGARKMLAPYPDEEWDEEYCKECRAKEPAKFTPGTEVWVVERTEGGTACEVSGFLFLAKVEHAVIVTPRVYGCEGVTEILDYHIDQTAQDYDTDLSVFPAGDCYLNKHDAKVALESEAED